MTRKSWGAVAILAILIAGGALLSRPGAGDSGPDGTLALRRFLANMGLRTTTGSRPPSPPGTFVLLDDFREKEAAQQLLDWVESGGRLVVADPLSNIADRNGITGRETPGSFGSVRHLQPGCVSPATAGVRRISVSSDDPIFSARGPTSSECFVHDRGAFAVAILRGSGEIFVLAGASPLTNALLGEDDNALFAYQLMAAGSEVVFGPPADSDVRAGCSGVWNCLPRAARVILIQLALAAAFYGIVRARRLGRPVPELQLSPIPAGELVRASGRLYRAAGACDHAATLLRRRAGRRWARRFGLTGMAPDQIAPVLAHAAALDEIVVLDLLQGPPPASDDELIALARELDIVDQRIEGRGL